jgi:LPS-assembly protein
MAPDPRTKRKPLYSALRKLIVMCAGMSLALSGQAETPNGDHAETTPAQEAPVSPPLDLDWVPIERLSESQRTLMRPHCCGAYVDPQRGYKDADIAPEQAPLRINADATQAQGKIATLTGDVQVAQGYRQVRSDKAVVNQETRTVDLDGEIIYREPGLLLTGESAHVEMDSGRMDISDVNFVFHEPGIRGNASQLYRPEKNKIRIDDVLYTSCEPGSNTWYLQASDVRLNLEKEIATARNVRLNVKDVPVVYLPWIQYPMSDRRTSGLLFPSILTGNDNGLDVAQPIYLNLAPQYDATFTPRLLQERGAMAELEFRYLTEDTMTVFSGGYLWDDNGGSSTDSYTGENRWSVGVDHRGGFGENWSSLIDYTDLSDDDYFRDIDSASLEIGSASHLNQQFKLGYDSAHWEFGFQVQEFETLIINGLEQYQQLPRIDADGHYPIGRTDLVLTLDQNFVVFDHTQDNIFGSGTPLTTDTRNTTITGNRFRGNYRLKWDREWLWGFFKPQVMAKYITYDLDEALLGQTETSPDVFVPVVAVDTGLFFERPAGLFEDHIQTFEPRFYYLNAQHEDQSAIPNFDTSELTFGYYQLFRDDRFSGGDRIGDTDQFTIGLTTRFIDQSTGVETLRLSIGQVYYLDDRQVSLTSSDRQELIRDNSDIAIELGGRFSDYWKVQTDVLTTDDLGVINKGNISVNYNNGENTVANFAYRYTRRENVLVSNEFIRADIDQAVFSFAYPVSNNWTLLGRYNQDLRTNQELEVFAGVQYQSCCWRASLVARRWVERDDNLVVNADELEHNNGLFIQIQFYGLAGMGKRVDNILSDGIYGYQPPQY